MPTSNPFDPRPSWLSPGRIVGIVGAVILGIFLLCILMGSWYTVDQGERGVILRNRAIIGVAQPGMDFKAPFIDSVPTISVQTQNTTFNDVAVHSSDQQGATLIVSVNWHVSDVEAHYREFGTDPNVMFARKVQPQVYNAASNVFGTFTAARAIQDKPTLNTKVQAALRLAVTDAPIVIESVQIEKVVFDDSYIKAISDQMQKVVALRAAESTAAQTKLVAEASAYATKVRGEGEAAAIRARGEALRENPGIPALITAEAQMEAAKKWDSHLPTTMVPGGALPFINVK